jgi:transcription elongation GreA/GreB family factor
MTKTGAERLRGELERLKSVDRPRIIAAIAEARAHGDLKEMPSTTRHANSRALPRAASASSRQRCRWPT